jgi:hypothetical protein
MKQTIILCSFLAGAMLLTTPVHAAIQESDCAARLSTVMEVSKDNRVTILRAYLHSLDSPLADVAQTFIREADKNTLDWKLVAAIAGVESTFGKHIPTGSYNAWGWGIFTGADDGVYFNGWADGITQVSEGLRKNYINRGARDIYEIGWIYAANGTTWGTHVNSFMDKIEQYTPVDPIALEVAI